MDFRSLRAGGTDDPVILEAEWRAQLVERHPFKTLWFIQHGYRPHIWQHLFHGAEYEGKLSMFRHLVAGRRGGKTLSAAWEVLFYALHPEEFHRDAHGLESQDALWIWALAKDHKLGNPSLITFIKVIRQAQLVKGKDYDYNKTEKLFTFYAGDGETETARVEFKSADDPESLRGAGLDILWIDESAFIPTRHAWDVVFPALADKEGIVLTTTTPNGKNWVWEEFFGPLALEDLNHFRVQYTSIDNPYFSRSRWEWMLKHYHPVMFKQECLAAFDALAGLSLNGEWLKFFVDGHPDIQTDDIGYPKKTLDDGTKVADLELFMAVDPAISLSDEADSFAIAIVGRTRDMGQAYLIDYYVGKLEFPDQIQKIREWFLKYRPHYIGIESVAYQKALAQMSGRMEGMPPIAEIKTRTTKKNDRIMQLGPIFKIGKVRIRKTATEFIDEWVNFDYEKRNNDDDLLDAVETALSAAGVLLPMPVRTEAPGPPAGSLEEEAWKQLIAEKNDKGPYDPELGSEA